jgi:metallopeptidase YgjP-like protein
MRSSQLQRSSVSTKSHSIEVRGVPVEIVRKDIKNLHLGVYPPNGRVRVAAPRRLNDDAVRLAVVTRIGWILRQRARFEQQDRQSEREMVSGDLNSSPRAASICGIIGLQSTVCGVAFCFCWAGTKGSVSSNSPNNISAAAASSLFKCGLRSFCSLFWVSLGNSVPKISSANMTASVKSVLSIASTTMALPT